ncbi:hypothetical protein [Neobacillus vireti]|uniref:Lipoprotein n=1 Tax=Neobacillus vireti LMG 21834 TaxID=1131730 RepID=A0AB94IKH3_9BACI|nr:hypothetical protein [Neobacillus vireti]ETI67493.1 hypothetical protein BAVI_17357 [Neobacillus vireti LMG 21834]KLT15489.1 hypothetical protein AA980_22815 [Neobacillus vireti]
MITAKKKKLLAGGFAVFLTFGLAGCGDGVDQDNGINDGEQKDAIDNDTKQESNDAYQEAKDNLNDIKNDVEKKIKEEEANDGVDDGEKADENNN